ncbi:MAG: cation diffusion facilitator family transporter, partial [Verrucomicrobiales bacterium]|nr:cation diffusion facilitator family transporter [Verrucomicrobiales bacterium]
MSAGEGTPTNDTSYNAVRRVLWAVLAANLAVTLIKIVLGLVTGALAVLADGFHSLVDTSSNLIGLAAIRLARQPADERHPYGYRRYETLGALAIGGLLLVAAWEIGLALVERVVQGTSPQVAPLSLGLLLFTFPVNIAVAVLEARAGRKLNSEILLTDAKHTQTDLYVGASVLVSVFGVWLGFPWLDVLVAAGVIGLIVRAGYSILRDTARWLTDVAAADPE